MFTADTYRWIDTYLGCYINVVEIDHGRREVYQVPVLNGDPFESIEEARNAIRNWREIG